MKHRSNVATAIVAQLVLEKTRRRAKMLSATRALLAIAAASTLALTVSSCAGGGQGSSLPPTATVRDSAAIDLDRVRAGSVVVAPATFGAATNSHAAPANVAATGSAYANAVLADAPQSYYRLGETGSTANDSSGHGRTGAYVGVGAGLTQATAGLLSADPQKSATWSGASGAYVSSPRDAALEAASGISLETWVKLSSVSAYQSLVEYGDNSTTTLKGFGLKFINRAFVLKLAIPSGSSSYTTIQPASENIIVGTVHHVVGTYDGAKASLYVDGQLVASKVLSGRISYDVPANNTGFVIGNNQSGRVATNGSLQEVAVYASALSAASIQNHYKANSTQNQVAFAGWNTYGFDNSRDGFNPNTTVVTPASIGGLHLAWQTHFGDFNTQTQPVLAANVPGHRATLFVGGGSGNVYAYDGTTGTRMWKQFLGQLRFSCDGVGTAYFGVGGSVVYDPASQSIFVPANANTSVNGPSTVSIVRLGAATGSRLGQIEIAANPLARELDFTHTSLALANGRIYLGTGSTCDISSWRGRVASADTNLSNTQIFYTTWNQGGAFSGGGVWGWGGLAVDSSGNLYTGVGNADTGSGSTGPQSPFVQTTNERAGYGEHFIKLSPNLASPLAFDAPGTSNAGDLDLTGSAMLFTPIGCNDTLAALQGKGGQLLTYDTQHISSGPLSRLQMSASTFEAPYLGNPGYSPITGLMYASVETATGSLFSPGMLAYKPTGCDGATSLAMAWRASFGPDSYRPNIVADPRSGVSVTAGGVVFVGTPCTADGSGGCAATASSSSGGAMWALDAANGTVLNGGKPIVITGDTIRMAPVIDGNWVYVTDNSSNLYAFTTDSSVPAKAVQRTSSDRRMSLSVRRRS